jgi:hypothetical protein
MKVDFRDVAWSVAALILLGWLGLEWRRSHLIAEEIRAANAAEAPIKYVNARLDGAAFYLEYRFRARCQIDWQSLQPLGLKSRTLITRTIRADNPKEAFEQLFGDQVEVIEDVEASQTMKATVLRVRARDP